MEFHKYFCSSDISTLEGKENKKRLPTLFTENAWSIKFCIDLTFRTLQHTSSEVTVITVTKHLKRNTKIKRGPVDKLKNNEKNNTFDS